MPAETDTSTHDSPEFPFPQNETAQDDEKNNDKKASSHQK